MDHGTNRWEETHMQPANSKGWEEEVSNGLLSGTISISNAYFIRGQQHVLNGPFLVQNFTKLKILISASCVCLRLMNTLSQFNFLFIFIRWQYHSTNRRTDTQKGKPVTAYNYTYEWITTVALPTHKPGRPEHTHWNEDPGIVHVTGKNPPNTTRTLPPFEITAFLRTGTNRNPFLAWHIINKFLSYSATRRSKHL
jgi:hypothetical protein